MKFAVFTQVPWPERWTRWRNLVKEGSEVEPFNKEVMPRLR